MSNNSKNSVEQCFQFKSDHISKSSNIGVDVRVIRQTPCANVASPKKFYNFMKVKVHQARRAKQPKLNTSLHVLAPTGKRAVFLII